MIHDTTLTLKRGDVLQVYVNDVANIRQVICQHEAATIVEIHCITTMLSAQIVDAAYNKASKSACRNAHEVISVRIHASGQKVHARFLGWVPPQVLIRNTVRNLI